MALKLQIEEAIERALTKGLTFYAYREPSRKEVEFGVQLSPLSPRKSGESGFIIEPFDKESKVPSVFIKQEYSLQNFPDDIEIKVNGYPQPNIEISPLQYKTEVSSLISQMEVGEYEKVVFSRTIDYKTKAMALAHKCFSNLCEKYPHACVYIFSVPNIATWMGATPEQLLEYDGDKITTMALAATRKSGEMRDFTPKEEVEQEIVVKYILEQIKSEGLQPQISDRYVLQAGPVEHLCNNIWVEGVNYNQAERVVSKLHPTPAVAGIPLKEALETILRAEKRPRRYYSGYLGGIKENNTFSLFVNLRSMELFPDRVQLYVGGGITSQSQVDLEWNETENKAQTLLKTVKEELKQ